MEDETNKYYKQGSMGFEPKTPPNIGKNIVPFPSEDSWSFDKERNKYYYIEQKNNNSKNKSNGFWKEDVNSSKYIYKTGK